MITIYLRNMSGADTPLNIVFVDDEVEILEALKRQMSLVEDYVCHFVSNPLEVYNVLQEYEIHIIVADVVMPEMDGITLLQDIKSKYPEIVRILLTAYGDYNTSLRAINEAEVFGFITKPWDSDYLMGHLNMANQMINKKIDDTILEEIPLLVVATWHDDAEITSIVHTGSNDLIADHFTKRVFMTSAALFGYKYRFQSNRFTLPLKKSDIVVRGALEKENDKNYGLFIFTRDIDEEERVNLDTVLDKMSLLIQDDIELDDLQTIKSSYSKYLNLS